MTIPIPYQWKRLSPNRRERLDRCIVAYLRRRYRQEDPSGSFRGCGRNGLPPWFPSYGESQPCCGFSTDNSIIPTRANPLALNTHCRSIGHLANLYDVDLNFLHRQLRLIRMSRVPPLIDAKQLAQQANDYAERMCDANSRERYTLNYIQGYIDYVENDRIRLKNIKHWFDYQIERNYQEESRRRRFPAPGLETPSQGGKLPFALEIDVADDGLDDFLSKLDKLIKRTKGD